MEANKYMYGVVRMKELLKWESRQRNKGIPWYLEENT